MQSGIVPRVAASMGLLSAVFIAFASAQAQQQPLDVVSETNAAMQASQQKVEQLDNQTQALLQQYRDITQKNDYQQYYQFQLNQLASEQAQKIKELELQLQELEMIEVAIMPLLQSMLASLRQFIALDLPFRHEERLQGVQKLEQRVNSASLSLPEKYRLMLEAWQIENDYGRTIETWRDSIDVDGAAHSVELLRLGRVALYYRSADSSKLAMWDKQKKSWQQLPAENARAISRAMDIAANRKAPDLLMLPLSASDRGQQ